MKRNYYIVALIMLTFFVISFITNIFGPLTPEIKNGFSLNYTLTAILYFAFFIAYGVMSIPAGMLIEKYNEKKMMIVSFLVVFAGSLLFALYPGYFIALPSLFIIGCGFAILQVVINPLLRTAGGEEHYAFNSVLAQLIFGGASFLSPLIYKYVAEGLKKPERNTLSFFHSIVPENLPWVSLYWIFAAIGLFMVIIVALSKFPKVELKEDEKAGVFATHIMLLKNKVVLLFFLGVICYVGTEQGIANNISQFLFTYHGYNPEQAGANAVAYFWGLMTGGGILGLLLLKIMDSRKVLIIFTILALTSLSAALFGPAKISLYAFPAVGFFASVMYPIIFSLALNSIKEHHGSFSGILCTGIIGGAIIPLIIGWLGDLFGLRTGMFFLYFTMGYILSIGFWAKPIISNKTIFNKKDATVIYE